MKISSIIKYALSLLYRKKFFLAIEMLTICISICLATHAFMNYYIVNESVLTVKALLEPRSDNVYKISIDSRATYNEETGINIYNFCEDFLSDENIDNPCIYHYENLYFTNDSLLYGGDALRLSSDALLLHELYNINGERIEFNKNEIIVGYNYKDDLPIGSTWQDHLGEIYIVKDVLAKGERWFVGTMIGADEFSVCLDDLFVTDINYDYFAIDPYYAYAYQNGIYFVCDNDDYNAAESYILELANKNKCPVTIYSAQKMIDNYIRTYNEAYFMTNFQTSLMLVLSFVGLFVANIISLLRQKNTLLIMYKFCVSRKDHVSIHIVNQIVQSVFAVCLAQLIMHRIYSGMFYTGLLYFNVVILAAIVTVLIAVSIIEIMTDVFLVRMLNEVNKSE